MWFEVFDRDGKFLFSDEVTEFSHYHVMRDYYVTGKSEKQLHLSADLIREIVKHENSEAEDS